MKACVVFVVLFTQTLLSKCVKVSKTYSDIIDIPPDIIGKSKTELSPLIVSARLNDVIVLSTPITNKNTLYYLGNPNGDNTKLDLNTSVVMAHYNTDISRSNEDFNDTAIKDNEGKLKAIITNAKHNRKILWPLHGHDCIDSTDDLVELENNLAANDFVIGPLTEGDHGNWVLSAFYRDHDGEWIELFQVITVEIVETLPTQPANVKLALGETFEPSFSQSITNLQSCQITPPPTTFDRFYDRDKIHLDSCGFRIPNVTREDEGMWRITGVGNIVYEGDVYLEINDKILY